MNDIQDLVTDVGSIVSSVRPGEIMTLKRVEEDYKAIYGQSIPFAQYGFNSLSKFIENFPNFFRVYFQNGIQTIQSNARNNITALIAKERRSKKPKNFQIKQINQVKNNHLNSRFIQKIKPMKAELPEIILEDIANVVKNCADGIHKDRLLFKFKQNTGYELRFRDYGFTNEHDLVFYLNGRALTLNNDLLCPLTAKGPSLFDLLRHLLSVKTGYTISCLQNNISKYTSTHIPNLIRSAGRFDFSEDIKDASSRGVLCYDENLIYGVSQKKSSFSQTFPTGVSNIRVIRVVSPAKFQFEILHNDSLLPRKQLHEKMQLLSINEPLLTMFHVNRYCSLKYNGEWYRAVLEEVRCDISVQYVTARFIDFPFEMEAGVQISLPTDRLRFIAAECEQVNAFIYSGSLAYVCPVDGRQWSRRSCDIFGSLVKDNGSCSFQSYLVDQTNESVSVDIVARTKDGEIKSIFQNLVQMELAQSTL